MGLLVIDHALMFTLLTFLASKHKITSLLKYLQQPKTLLHSTRFQELNEQCGFIMEYF